MKINTELEQLIQQLFEWASENGADESEVKLGEDQLSATYELGLLVSNADQSYDGYLDIQIEPNILSLHLYTDILIPDENISAANQMIDDMNKNDEFGLLQLIGNDNRLRLSGSVELKGDEPLGILIDEIIPIALEQLDDSVPRLQAMKN